MNTGLLCVRARRSYTRMVVQVRAIGIWIEHDIHYRTGATLAGVEISRAEADKIFRECMQARSIFWIFSPMSWWRWAAVRLFGVGSYASKR